MAPLGWVSPFAVIAAVAHLCAAHVFLIDEPAGGSSIGTIRIDWREGQPHLPDVPVPESSEPRTADSVGLAAYRVDAELELHWGTTDAFEAYSRAWHIGGFQASPLDGWFGQSNAPRLKRPEHVLPVGSVYTHRLTGARGVIVGWDLRLEAPREWADTHEGNLDYRTRLARLHEPHYSVLEEMKREDGSFTFMQRYVVAMCLPMLAPPSCLQVENPAKTLSHPQLKRYFSAFNSIGGYVPNDDLAHIYPQG
mmetsp:Transcript_27090/g.82056  ORF Transcript_27090/g.82056 Transcript_27090/m.82056 type:complete len:251 (+) Transcript_27090:303-1055(+)